MELAAGKVLVSVKQGVELNYECYEITGNCASFHRLNCCFGGYGARASEDEDRLNEGRAYFKQLKGAMSKDDSICMTDDEIKSHFPKYAAAGTPFADKVVQDVFAKLTK